mmetsp:Transcript_36700/g.65642  ORF Transcript_36700/g.65642 Transcript_36700/m.65642 type:complete len:246 (+) Transcript_36700:1483-2220(+)
MTVQQILQLRRGNLEPLCLDQLLAPIHDEAVPLGVHVPHVPCVQPAVRVDGLCRGGGVVQVPEHDVGSAQPELPRLPRAHILPRFHIHNPEEHVGYQAADTAVLPQAADPLPKPHRRRVGWGCGGHDVAHGGHLRHAIPLSQGTTQALDAGLGELVATGRGPSYEASETGEVVLVHHRGLGQEVQDGGRNVGIGHAVLLDGLQERPRLKLLAGDDLDPLAEPAQQDQRHSVDVEERQHRDNCVPP